MHSNTRRPAKSLITLATIALVALASFAVSACSEQTAADTWLKPNQNAANTRYTGGRISTSTVNNLAVGWTVNQRTKAGFGSKAPSPFITANNVFVQAPAGNIVGFDLKTGALSAGVKSPFIATRLPSWVVNRGGGKLRTLSSSISPMLTTGDDDEPIAVGAAGSRVSALSAQNGEKEWSTEIKPKSGTNARVISNMAAAGGKIFVPVANVPTDVTADDLSSVVEELTGDEQNNGQLVALDSDDGDVAWTKKLASVPLGAATVVNDIVFTSTLDGNVYGFDASSGDQVWTSPLPAGAVAPIAAYSGTLIVPAGFVYKRGQKAQVVAFTIGGLGSIGGPAAPRIKEQAEQVQAEKSTGELEGGEEADGADGKALFVANCAGCHTLAAAGTSGTSGPVLDGTSLSEAQIAKQIENGGGGMPGFKASLSPEEIAAISKYIASVAGG